MRALTQEPSSTTPAKRRSWFEVRATFAEEARHGQRGFKIRSFGQRLVRCVEAVGGTAQKGCAGFAAGLRVGSEGFGAQFRQRGSLLRPLPSRKGARCPRLSAD